MLPSERPPTATASTDESLPLVPFANDPVRTPGILPLTTDQIAALNGPHFLSTALIDFILQQTLKDTIPPNLLIGSSNSMSFLELSNNKINDSSNTQSIARMRHSYFPYSLDRFRFLAATCTEAHFFVVDVTFDIRSDNIFQNVTLYDSLRKTGRRDQGRLNSRNRGAQFLRRFQNFLAQYCFVDDDERCQLLLKQQPDLIIEKCTVVPCPQQQNGYDCALFAVGVLVHLANDIQVQQDLFSQAEITYFRQQLWQRLSVAQALTPQFLLSCFPKLTLGPEQEGEGQVKPVEVQTSENSSSHQQQLPTSAEKTEEQLPTSAEKTEDLNFIKMFTTMNKEDIVYDSTEALVARITEYEETSGIRLVIRQSYEGARTFRCSSHRGCCFKAKFGPKRGSNHVILKIKLSVLAHCGARVTAASDGRALKKRVKMKLLPFVDKVALVKEGQELKAGDVMKASANNMKGFQATYHQSYRAVARMKSYELTKNERSFQLMLPYIQKFNETNPNSCTMVEKDHSTNRLKRVFVCPGIMDRSLNYVRPVMSFHAVHLKSPWEGTLHVASVKSACDEIYPVAVAILEKNENSTSGWRWFLENLRTALPTLRTAHPRREVTKKYFTFVCDHQEGLLEALHEVFPENHSCICAVNIAHNVQMKRGGEKIAKYILPLASTFSPSFGEELLSQLSSEAREYVEGIERSRWRNTAWLEDPSLPPRYGITTSNLSEANAVFEKARNASSWLYSIHTFLTKMVERISDLRMQHEGQSGVVESVVGILEKRWEHTAHYKVMQLEENGGVFSVFRDEGEFERDDDETYVCTTLDLELRRCSCGEWQEHGIPCVHALAYLKEQQKLSFEEILSDHVEKQYTYDMEKKLLQKNIMPVCVERIFPDGCTSPPSDAQLAKAPGCLTTKRLRVRSKWANEPDKSPIICSRCGKRGHNVRTCVIRETLEDDSTDKVVVAAEKKKRKLGDN
jgi:SWIM zinc finger/MULE transposase domain/Ulp1 protease family, C-terminal catalytic domain